LHDDLRGEAAKNVVARLLAREQCRSTINDEPEDAL
jgi:hypothetical protein